MFKKLKEKAKDKIFKLLQEYKNDPNQKKINLGIGIFLDENGKTYVHKSVQKSFKKISTKTFNYQPIQGNKEFLNLTFNFLFQNSNIQKKQLALQACCGGTHGCSLFSQLVEMSSPEQKILIAEPTWGNHFKIFDNLKIVKFNHLDSQTKEPSFDNYKKAITENPNSILLLHGGLAHNPTGKNLSLENLKKLIPLIKENNIYIFLDYAYLGLSEGIEKDLEYLNLLFENLENISCSVSFSKNATLYEHRTGLLIVKNPSPKIIESNLQYLVRKTVSQPPGIGQKIIIDLLKNKKNKWLKELENMRLSLEKRKNSLDIKNTFGMFTLLNIDPQKIHEIRKQHSLYLPENSRINFGGIKVKEIKALKDKIFS